MLTPTQVGDTPSVRRVRASCRAWGSAMPDPSTVALITSAFNMTFISHSEPSLPATFASGFGTGLES